MKLMKASHRIILTTSALFFICLVFNSMAVKSVCAATKEKEPNDTQGNAQTIMFGEEYSGVVTIDDSEDVDYFRIPVKEGNFYKITLYNMKDFTEFNWATMIISLCKESNTEDEYILNSQGFKNVTSLFRAAYSGNYYLKVYNSIHAGYSFKIERYNPAGKKVKDYDSNVYKITGNYSLEFAKAASKKDPSFVFTSKKYFSSIGGIELLDPYRTPFTVTSIGNYAFKECRIDSITLPANIKTIGIGAFQNCKKLGEGRGTIGVFIHGKKVRIKAKAFQGCKNLRFVRILKSASVSSVAKNAFKGTHKKLRMEVPNVKKYKKIFKNAGLKKPVYKKTKK